MKGIKKMREDRKLSQLKLSQEIGVLQQSNIHVETGESLPQADKLLQLAELLGCTVDDLLRMEAEEPRKQKTET